MNERVSKLYKLFIFLIIAYFVIQIFSPIYDFFTLNYHFLCRQFIYIRRILHLGAFLCFSFLVILSVKRLRILSIWLMVLSATITLAFIEEALDLLKYLKISIDDIVFDVYGAIIALSIYTMFFRKKHMDYSKKE